VRVLEKAKSFAAPRGLIYVELPDGDGALKHGNTVDREEFYIEHFTIFTPTSLKFLAENSTLSVLDIRQIHEPSDKYSIYAFLSL
jgi:hypothetical protein